MSINSRRQREQQVRRDLILDSAKHLFEDKGFDATTVEEIAVKAELGKGTIYSYFQSKEEIYIAILEEGLEVLETRMSDAIQGSSGAIDALYNLYDTFIEYHREQTGFIESVLLQVDRKFVLRLDNVVNGLKKKVSVWMELVGNVLQKGIQDGEFKKVDIEKTTRIIIGMIIGLIFQHEMEQTDEELADYRESVFGLTLEGLKLSK